jgi:hypothetical protein
MEIFGVPLTQTTGSRTSTVERFAFGKVDGREGWTAKREDAAQNDFGDGRNWFRQDDLN